MLRKAVLFPIKAQFLPHYSSEYIAFAEADRRKQGDDGAQFSTIRVDNIVNSPLDTVSL